ncbi:hypothetical protein OG216_44590 [Streptomycetaceae bacterium NBC_01309]
MTQAEITTARAYLGCRGEVNLVPLWFGLESAYQRQLIEKHAQELEEVESYLAAVRENTQAVLAGSL